MSEKHSYISVKGQYEGFHTYPDAPDEVAFLRLRHRHLFKWEAAIEVYHHDRELEFFMVKWYLDEAIAQMHAAIGGDLGSCERQADIILEAIRKKWGERYIWVEVSEDGENAGVVEYIPERN